MGGLDHGEAVRRPEIGEWRVAVQRGEVVREAVAMREEDDRQLASGHGRGDSHLQVHGAAGSWQHYRADRQDRSGRADGAGVVGRFTHDAYFPSVALSAGPGSAIVKPEHRSVTIRINVPFSQRRPEGAWCRLRTSPPRYQPGA